MIMDKEILETIRDIYEILYSNEVLYSNEKLIILTEKIREFLVEKCDINSDGLFPYEVDI